MNYLAHLYLSGDSEKLLVGNFIGDYVKGKQYQKLPKEIADGILLHRAIDTFTDKHPCHQEAKQFFKGEFNHYAGIIIDVVYDHFLAKNWEQYSAISLRWYTKRAHAVLLGHFRYLPLRVQGFLPFLIQNKRLESYASTDGIIDAVRIMGNYTSLPQKSENAKQILLDNYDDLEQNFTIFMEAIIEYIKQTYKIDIKKPGY